MVPLSTFLDGALATDVLIQISPEAALDVFGKAQEIAAFIAQKARSKYTGAAEFIPRGATLDLESAWSLGVKKDQVRVTLAFIPTSHALRSQLAFFRSELVNAEFAIDLPTLSFALSKKPEQLAAITGIKLPTAAAFQQDQNTGDVILATRRTVQCLQTLGDSTADQRPVQLTQHPKVQTITELRTIMRLAGFPTPAMSHRDPRVTQSEVTYCAAKPADAKVADRITTLMRACDLGNFTVSQRDCRTRGGGNQDLEVRVAN
jgi:hypothetical protein